GTLAGATAFGDMSTPAAIALIAACIGGLGARVIGEAILLLTTPAFYARHDTLIHLQAMALRLIIAVTAAVAAYALVPGPVGLMTAACPALAAGNLVAGAYL